jgi:type IV pilus assembly protein PilM
MMFHSLRQRLAGTPAAPPIGVDFAAERLNMLQLAPDSPAGVRVAVGGAVSVPYPMAREQLFAAPRLLARFVQAALAQAPFVGRRAYCALAPADVRILPLTVVLAPGQSEAQAVARAVGEQIGMAVDDSVIDYYQVRSIDGDSTERQVLVAVAQRSQVLAYLEQLRVAGLDPVALDIGPAAIARLLAAMQREDLNQSVLLINFGVNKSFLTVIWGRRLMLDREIDFGEVQLAGKLAASLAMAPEIARALMREHGIGARSQARFGSPPGSGGAPAGPDIRRTIREILHPEFALLAEELVRTQLYVASRTRGSTLSRVYLNGSLARYPDIQERLGELVALPVEILDPFVGFSMHSANRWPGVGPSIALAAGLALREAPRG